jgi:gliding motility-associated-like protein
VTVTGWALPTPDAGPDQIVPEGGTASIGGAGNPEWEHTWEPALDVVSPEAASTATEALFSATEFILTATTLEGCAASDTVFVDVLLELDIPSGFTPNADGINDAWNLGGLDQYPSAEITLFNRWGDVLLTYGSTDGSWDGTLNGIPVPVGTYYYHIRVNEPALQAEWTGPITLMR